MATFPTLISVPVSPPTSTDISNFDSRADTFLQQVQEMSVAIQALSTDSHANGIEAREARLTYIGTWSGATAYEVGNVVKYGSKVYRCTVANTNSIPDMATEPYPWQVVLQAGNYYDPEKLSITVGGPTTTTNTQTKSNIMSSGTINCFIGSIFTKTITANTTLAINSASIASSGYMTSFVLELTNAGAHTITWWSGILWSYGIVPTLTSVGTDVLYFYTYDAGTTWVGVLVARDIR